MKKKANLKTLLVLQIFLQAICLSTSVFADCELAKLLASNGAVSQFFGYSVAISGDTAVIGAYREDDNGDDSGSVYIFHFDGLNWVEETKLLTSDGMECDWFGYSVAISGNTAVIGACRDNDNGPNSGSAYIFRYDTLNWIEKAKLLASDGAASDRFGYSVALSGDIAVIGAVCDDDNGGDSGSAYIFRFDGSNWVEEAKLLASDGAEGDCFGHSVAISGNTAVIGAVWDDDNGIDSGSAYIFRFDGSNWVEEAKLLASDSTEDDRFGCSVSVSCDIAVIGAYHDDDNGGDSGSAYIFRCDGSNWIEETKFLASDGAANDAFGISVALSGNRAVIGSYRDDDNSNDSGSAYMFSFDGSDWIEEAKLLASDGTEDDRFGCSVSISGDMSVVGAYHDDDNGTLSGSAYIFGLHLNPGDIDLDNNVDFIDYSLFAQYWLETDCGPCNCDRADFTRDGIVDENDLAILTFNWLVGTE